MRIMLMGSYRGGRFSTPEALGRRLKTDGVDVLDPNATLP